MNSQKYLILIRGEDKTEDILNYEKNKNYININYKNTDKVYTYSKNDFEFYKDPIEVNMKKNKVFMNQGYIYNTVKVLKFEKHYKIFFEDDDSIIVEEKYIKIVENDDKRAISSNKFEYFKEISKIVSIRTEEGKCLLTKEYEKINFIKRNTALYKYITPSYKTEVSISNKTNELIFPFGANKSQFEAVRNAMNNQISIIEGPPRNRENSNNIKYYCKYFKKRTNCCNSL